MSRPEVGRGMTPQSALGRGSQPRPAAGRGGRPQPGAGRGALRSVSPGRGASSLSEVVCVVSSLPSASGGFNFHDEVQSDELESFVAPQSKLRCRVMDVENCDSSLSLEEFDPSSTFDFRFPRVGDRIRMPPLGYFTVYSAFFSSGFTLPPHPLLMDIIKEFGLCVSQFTPNTFTYFEGFLYRFRELGLPLTIESFFTFFSVRKAVNDSFFFFFPQSGCRFLDGSASSKGSWKEKFFFVRDSDWDLTTSWGEVSPVLSEKRRREASLSPPPLRLREADYGQEGSGKDNRGAPSSSKRPRELEATEAPHGIGKELFSYGSNSYEGVASFWDASDYDLAYVRSRNVVSDYDVARLSSLGDHTVSRPLFGESARVATLTEIVDQRFKSYDKELKRSEAALEEMKKELARCQEQLKEVSEGQTKWRYRYNREVSSGQGFLRSEAGKTYLECVWNDFKEKYEDSEEFEGAVVARANDIYDQAIRQCRAKLRESGRFVEEDFTFLDPLVADEDVAEEGEVEVVDEPPAEGACVDVGGDRP
ncbi:hypothetical protein Sango_2046300 [Sesamum angolense]|uniref:Transposase (putative) gypsy type domain-containing protein n=1 Tax=Sesamum angolense TaxID=2727404 RepID=A0AAE1WFY0_9LAMI|nr:hypothetical protein Sango_2046300 [Sesamum angolense]